MIIEKNQAPTRLFWLSKFSGILRVLTFYRCTCIGNDFVFALSASKRKGVSRMVSHHRTTSASVSFTLMECLVHNTVLTVCTWRYLTPACNDCSVVEIVRLSLKLNTFRRCGCCIIRRVVSAGGEMLHPDAWPRRDGPANSPAFTRDLSLKYVCLWK